MENCHHHYHGHDHHHNHNQDQSVTNILEYFGHKYLFEHSRVSNLLKQIYSDIRSRQICLYEYIRTFVRECVRV